jgi:hypothetical protein
VPCPRPLFAVAATEALLIARREGSIDDASIIAGLSRENVLDDLADPQLAPYSKLRLSIDRSDPCVPSNA